MHEVAVIGSINVDRAVEVPVAPTRGATLLGGPVRIGPGGKGANQAVALARLGRKTAMIGAVGRDSDGAWMREVLRSERVSVDDVVEVEDPTGQAFVFVEPNGESTIVVSPGANMAVGPDMLNRHSQAIAGAKALLVQQEIPAEAVESAARLCTGLFVLNPAPARPIPAELLSRVDVLVPNRYELGSLFGSHEPGGMDEIAKLASSLPVSRGVVVTLGKEGALVVEGGAYVHVPAMPVEAVDATAAGDTFCAALVDGLLEGWGLVDAARWAVKVAAVTTERKGAMAAIPSREEVERRFGACSPAK
jgi:ribokinase